jgi:hypothetical protein
MNTAKTLKYYTKEEYLARLMASPVKLEYHNGFINMNETLKYEPTWPCNW